MSSSRPDTAPDQTRRPPLPVLTSLRFFAATAGVVYHGFLPWQSSFMSGLSSAGYQAVTFFFVLSGFILTYVYTDTVAGRLNVTARIFWKARFARISPAYYVGLLVALPAFLYGTLISKVVPILPLPFALLIIGGAGGGVFLKWLTLPFLTYLGEVSYSIYILHSPIWFWWEWALREVFVSSLSAYPRFIAYYLIVILASILCYQYVERPMRKFILGHRAHRTS